MYLGGAMRNTIRRVDNWRNIGILGKQFRAVVPVALCLALLAGCSSGPQPPWRQFSWKMPTIKLPTIKNPFSSDKLQQNAVALAPDQKGPKKPAAPVAAIPSSVAQAPASPAVHLSDPAGMATAVSANDPDQARNPQIDPRQADALSDQAFKLYSAGKLAEAESVMLKAVALRPSDVQLRNNLGVIYGHEGRSREALEQFRLAGSEADACANVGTILAAQNDLTGAKDYLRRALAADPNHARAQQALAALPEGESKRLAEKPWPATIR